jgi:septum formation protein
LNGSPVPPFSLPVELVLASTSRYRIGQLERFGVVFRSVAPEVDEQAIVKSRPLDTVIARARAKARSVVAREAEPSAWVVAADQGVVLQDDGGRSRLLGKPGQADRAVEQLMELAGRSHTLATAVVLSLPGGQVLEEVEQVTVTMRAYSRQEAIAVVERDRTWDCAGAYKIEAAGPWLMESVQANDPTAIEGLPLIALGRLLRRALAST